MQVEQFPYVTEQVEQGDVHSSQMLLIDVYPEGHAVRQTLL